MRYQAAENSRVSTVAASVVADQENFLRQPRLVNFQVWFLDFTGSA
jgi:hypothetical protein